ncbi:MAG: hypothetical protein ACYCW6_24350 [Candidatus Xenobia bacterium]
MSLFNFNLDGNAKRFTAPTLYPLRNPVTLLASYGAASEVVRLKVERACDSAVAFTTPQRVESQRTLLMLLPFRNQQIRLVGRVESLRQQPGRWSSEVCQGTIHIEGDSPEDGRLWKQFLEESLVRK